MTPGESLIAAARVYLGAPFVHAGRTATGVDCVGLLIAAARDAGLADYDYRNYSRVVNPAVLLGHLQRFLRRLDAPREALLPGDVLLFCPGPQHVALLTAPWPEPRMIHAWLTLGRVAEHALDESWQRRLAMALRWRDDG